jgi:enterochelin esterase-like enzyme
MSLISKSAIIFFLVSISPLAGTVIKTKMSSKELNRTWNYTVFLPEGYDSSSKKYPVIYLLHGNGDDENDWQNGYDILDSLINNKIIPPVIAVTPSGKRSWWVNTSERFESAAINELIPEIDSLYNTVSSRDGRMIAGYSMGGFGALRYGLVYPDLFRACAIFSPALYNEEPPEGSSARSTGAFGNPFDINLWNELNYPSSIKKYMKNNFEVFFYVGAGDDDWNHAEGKKYNVEYQTMILYQHLNKELKIPAELRIINGGHSWKVWKPLFIEAVKLFLQKQKFAE